MRQCKFITLIQLDSELITLVNSAFHSVLPNVRVSHAGGSPHRNSWDPGLSVAHDHCDTVARPALRPQTEGVYVAWRRNCPYLQDRVTLSETEKKTN